MKLVNKEGKRNVLIGSCILFLLIVFGLALLAPWIAPHDPNEIDLSNRLTASSGEHLLGTDHLGRDVLSRLIFGVRISLVLVFAVFFLSVTIGVLLGMMAGYIGGWFDAWMMRFCDGMLAFPNLVLVLGIVGMLGPGIYQVVIALLLVQWVYFARMTRGLVLHLRQSQFLLSARIAGASKAAILRRHILPHIFPQIAVIGTLEMGWAIMDISALSFLGLGIQPPTAEWGAMINEGRAFIRTHPQLMLYPGLCILLVVSSFNLLGEALAKMFSVSARKE